MQSKPREKDSDDSFAGLDSVINHAYRGRHSAVI